jgi:hypothetical protein
MQILHNVIYWLMCGLHKSWNGRAMRGRKAIQFSVYFFFYALCALWNLKKGGAFAFRFTHAPLVSPYIWPRQRLHDLFTAVQCLQNRLSSKQFVSLGTVSLFRSFLSLVTANHLQWLMYFVLSRKLRIYHQV